MILANVIFGRCHKQTKEQLDDIAECYLASLFRTGQICGEYFLTWTKGRLNAHLLLAGPGAFELRYHSDHGKKRLDEVVQAFGNKPTWKILDDDARKRPPSWKGAPFLYLFTHALDRESPVCRGDGRAPVPVFFLPISFELKDRLYFWQKSYYYHDNIWFKSGALEIAAYRQLADPNSELAQEGRELCRELEAATGVPTFYYLMRYWGRLKGEDERPCPGCGTPWKTTRTAKTTWRFCEFDFRCDPCRLVSHVGVAKGGGRHARHTRIGEFSDQNQKAKLTGKK